VAIVGAGAVAITATSAGVAVARSAPSQPHRSNVPSVAPRHPGGGDEATAAPHSQSGSRSGDPRVTGSQSSGAETASPPPSKTQSVGGKPLPTDAPTAVPTLSGPVQFPTSLPTHVPTILPTGLPVHLPVPAPSISVSVPTQGPLLGH
jgi:hypothetical protein